MQHAERHLKENMYGLLVSLFADYARPDETLHPRQRRGLAAYTTQKTKHVA
jgi:hypothetical protein